MIEKLKKFSARISALVSRFFPPAGFEQEEDKRRATIFAWICLGVIVLCSIITLIDAFLGNTYDLISLGAFVLFLGLLLVLLRRGVDVSILGNALMAVSFLFTVYLMFNSGGLLSPLVIYLMIVPAFVVLISNKKWVVLWTVAGVVAIAIFCGMHLRGVLAAEISDLDYYLSNATANYISAIVFIALLFLYSETARIKAQESTLQAKERSDNLLLNILPEQTAAELKDTGTSPAKSYESVTVLFTDFKGFTQASEQMSPVKLIELLNDYFMRFDRIMDTYGVEKIKTIGDAYMAAGGLPVPNDNSVKNTVLAALEMQAFISKRKVELDAKGLPGFEMRVGVHTGPVVAGIVGIKKFQYDIWGDTVNTASRMESSGEVGKVNISEATYNLLKVDTLFSFSSRGKIEAKGKGEMEMYFAENAQALKVI